MNEWRPPLWPHNCQLPERPSTMLIIIIFQGTVTEAGDVLISSTSPEVNLQHTYHITSPVSVASRESPTLDGPTTDEDADDERYQGTIAIVCLLQEYLPGWLVGCKVTKRWGKRWWLAKNISTICLHFCPRAHYSQFKMTPHNWKYSRHISRGAWLQYSYIPPRPHTHRLPPSPLPVVDCGLCHDLIRDPWNERTTNHTAKHIQCNPLQPKCQPRPYYWHLTIIWHVSLSLIWLASSLDVAGVIDTLSDPQL